MIVEKCHEAGLQTPDFEQSEIFRMVFCRKDDTENVVANGVLSGGAIGKELLTERQIEILNILRNNPVMSYRAISKQLNINDSAVLKHLNNLKRANLIERIGGTRGYWEVVNDEVS